MGDAIPQPFMVLREHTTRAAEFAAEVAAEFAAEIAAEFPFKFADKKVEFAAAVAAAAAEVAAKAEAEVAADKAEIALAATILTDLMTMKSMTEPAKALVAFSAAAFARSAAKRFVDLADSILEESLKKKARV